MTSGLEIRSVLIAGGPIGPLVSHSQWLSIGDGAPLPEVEAIPGQQAVSVHCAGATQIDLMHHGELVRSVQSEQAEIPLDRRELGAGPLRLRPIAVVDGRRIPGRAISVSDGG